MWKAFLLQRINKVMIKKNFHSVLNELRLFYIFIVLFKSKRFEIIIKRKVQWFELKKKSMENKRGKREM